MRMAIVTLGLGANLGERLDTLQRSVALLAERGVVATASSRVWESEPVGGPRDQPAYLNVVVRAHTNGTADDTLRAAHQVEAELRRTRE
ncbi:MAG: 2-amino-4-hydroxy-6-hydroxymethyldihydropteridine diphosphokinase, partial [Actinomycetota bacterium]